MNHLLKLCLCLCLTAPYSSKAAVSLSQNNTGQALSVPFFTVANGLNTLVTINNTQDQPKAIKINIKDGRQSATMISFNLYLAANDTYAFAMVDDLNGPVLISSDQSCTLQLTGTQPGVPTPLPEWNRQTGSIEIIEMGNVLTQSNDFFGNITSTENCQRLNDAWYANGPNSFWQAESTAELSPVSGGLTADVSVIDVSSGFAFKIPLLAFENFFPAETIFHTEPEAIIPDLSSGTHDSILLHAGQVIQTTWPTGYEAISALLMKTTLENEYDVALPASGFSEWVFSFPTLVFHKNNPNTQVPFIFEDEELFRFPGTPSNDYEFFNREGSRSYGIWACVLPPPGVYCPPINFLNHAVSTYVVNPDGTDTPISRIASTSAEQVRSLNIDGSSMDPTQFLTGKVKLYIKSDTDDDRFGQTYATTNTRGKNTLNGQTQKYLGLPVVGFAVQMYNNSNAQPGLLATYASAKAHYSERIISEEDN